MGKSRTLKYQVGKWYYMNKAQYQCVECQTIRVNGVCGYRFVFGNKSPDIRYDLETFNNAPRNPIRRTV